MRWLQGIKTIAHDAANGALFPLAHRMSRSQYCHSPEGRSPAQRTRGKPGTAGQDEPLFRTRAATQVR